MVLNNSWSCSLCLSGHLASFKATHHSTWLPQLLPFRFVVESGQIEQGLEDLGSCLRVAVVAQIVLERQTHRLDDCLGQLGILLGSLWVSC